MISHGTGIITWSSLYSNLLSNMYKVYFTKGMFTKEDNLYIKGNALRLVAQQFNAVRFFSKVIQNIFNGMNLTFKRMRDIALIFHSQLFSTTQMMMYFGPINLLHILVDH